jgi:hypothetical protein
MARASKHDGVVYRRADGKIWWMSYRDASGGRLETTNTDDWVKRNAGCVNVSVPATIAHWRSYEGANSLPFRIGQTPSWRTTRSRRSGHRKPRSPMSGR